MRFRLRLGACVGLALLMGACNSVDSQYFREGIGTGLYATDLPDATQFERAYVAHICEQAGFGATDEGCAIANWATFVQAGMNDIDRRCDGYLAWLDNRKRSTGPILKQIADTSIATQGIMRLAGVGADPITIAGLAFGFAASTFTNVNSRLLTELNHSTVQTVVLNRQNGFRNDLKGRLISTRPDAIHALRQYLRICMPFTIETEINTTITAFERGGAGALESRDKLVSSTTVGTPAAPFMGATPLPRTAGPRTPPAGGATSAERAEEVADLAKIQDLICVRPTGAFDPQTRQGLRILQETLGATNPTGEINRRDLRAILQQLSRSEFKEVCKAPHVNFYERTVFNKSEDILRFQNELNRWIAGGRITETGALGEATRAKIAAVRAAMPALKDPPGLGSQVTPAFRVGVLTPPPEQLAR